MTTDAVQDQSTVPKEKRNHTLDFLRGLAILGVVCVHCDLEFPTSFKQLDGLFRLGSFGVQLFFFVSALTMCYMWELRENESGRMWKFYLRRFLRIAPLFWLAIPLYLWLNGSGPSHWAPGGISSLDVFLTATFLQGFWPEAINSVVPGGWSIAVEMSFYVVFPLLITRFGKRTPFLVYAGVIFLINLWIIAPVWGWALNTYAPSQLPRLVKEFLQLQFFSQAFIFLLGMHLYKTAWSGHRMNLRREVVFFLGWFALMGIRVYPSGNTRELVAFFWIVCAYALVASALRCGWRNKLVELFGRKSYSIYLTHFAVIVVVQKLFASWSYTPDASLIYFSAGFIAVLSLSYVAASILYYLVEQPLHRLTMKLAR